MKKIFYLASIAALAFSSCAKDETTEAAIDVVKGGSKITAAVEANDTRTHLDSNLQFRWSEGDQLGVYGDGTNTLRNAAFTVSPNDAGKAQGVFTSQQEELVAGKHYLAVYPRFQQSRLFDVVNWKKNEQLPFEDDGVKGDVMDHETIRVSIPATQTYKDASFYTGIAPAISNNFTVANDGIGSLSMQPVADYLFVNIKSTEPIEQIELNLYEGTTQLDIAGTAVLNKYALENETIRYYASVSEDASKTIKLETNESDKAVTCHDPNTYVFVVPGGILGKNNDIRAKITVNGNQAGATNNVFRATSNSSYINGETGVTNAQMNYYVPNPLKAANDSDNKMSYRKASATKTDPRGKITNVQTKQLENMVFWMNPMIDTNNDGVADTRSSFEYNPSGDVIIENEAELLQYLVEYEKNTDSKFAGMDAFICDNYKFDFSIANIENLSAKLKSLGTYSEFEQYLKDYVGQNGVFPCISEFENEFNGNGATISGIVRPLASANGIFGAISGSVKDVTFSGITPKTVEVSNYGHNYPGYVLGAIDGGSIDDVTVDKAKGMAVLAKGDVAAYEELTLTNVEGLNFIIADMNIKKDLKFKNFDVASKVAYNVFATLNAEADDAGDSHHVVTLPAGADYDALAMYIGNDDTDYQAAINLAIAGIAYAPLAVVNDDDNNVVSVLVGETSYWTGDKFPLTYPSSLYPKTFDKGAYKDWYKLEYAEQLATGATSDINAYVMRDMNLSKSPMSWEMVTVGKLEADGETTISGLNMAVELDPQVAVYAIAPVDAKQIKNLIVDGVAIDIYTPQGTVVPDVISGLAWRAQLIEGVTVKNLSITGDGEGANNEDYNGSHPVIIGWLVGDAKDISVKNSKVVGVTNEITGIAGLVGKISFSDPLSAAANIEDSYAENVKAQAALPKFRDINKIYGHDAWTKLNTAGTAVGLVENTTEATKSIKITGKSGKAVFLFDTTPTFNQQNAFTGDSPINVLYGNGDPITLTFNTRGEWWW